MKKDYLEWGRRMERLDDLRLLPPQGVLARCLYGEARGVDVVEAYNVGSVVRNRVRYWVKPPHKASDWADVILKPKQFSWSMENDPNFKKVLHPMKFEHQNVWEKCCIVAEGVVAGSFKDDTKNADHYYDVSMLKSPPSWVKSMSVTLQTPHFIFLRSDRCPAC